MANPWFRFYAEFLHDPKVRVMSDSDQLRLVLLLCLRCNGDVTLQDKHVTFSLRISDAEWQQTKAVFVESGFIDSDNNVLNWDRRQFVSDSSVERVRRHRALHKPVTETSCNVTVTPPEQNRTEQNRTDIAIGKPNCPHQEIINLYHELLPASPRIKDWTPARSASLRARWNEDDERQRLGYWRGLFEYIAGIPFLTGKVASNGRKPFMLSLDWLLKAENFAKVREGRYEDQSNG